MGSRVNSFQQIRTSFREPHSKLRYRSPPPPRPAISRRRRNPTCDAYTRFCYFHRRYGVAARNCEAPCAFSEDAPTRLPLLPEPATRSPSCESCCSDDWWFPNQEARDRWRERRAQRKLSRATATNPLLCTPASVHTDIMRRPLKGILKTPGGGPTTSVRSIPVCASPRCMSPRPHKSFNSARLQSPTRRRCSPSKRGLCRFHQCHGAAARNCSYPCSWFTNTNSAVTSQHSQDHGDPFDSADSRYRDQEAQEFWSTRYDHQGLSRASQLTQGLVKDSSPLLSPALTQDHSQREAVSSYTSDVPEAIEISIARLFSAAEPSTKPEAISMVQTVQDQQIDDHPPIIHCLAPTSSSGQADAVVPTPPSKPASIIDTTVASLAQDDDASVRDNRTNISADIILSSAAARKGGSATIFTSVTEPLLSGTLLHTTQTASSGTHTLDEMVHACPAIAQHAQDCHRRTRRRGLPPNAPKHILQCNRRRQTFCSHLQNVSVKCPQKTKRQAATFLRARSGTLSSVGVACQHNMKFAYWKRRRSGRPPSHIRLEVAEEVTTQTTRLRLRASQSFAHNRQLPVASVPKCQRPGGSTRVIAATEVACPSDGHREDAVKRTEHQPPRRMPTLPTPAPLRPSAKASTRHLHHFVNHRQRRIRDMSQTYARLANTTPGFTHISIAARPPPWPPPAAASTGRLLCVMTTSAYFPDLPTSWVR